VHGTAAGLHLLITFSSAVDDAALAATALQHGVKVQPLSWHAQRPAPPGLVLGYAARTPDDLAAAVQVLARLIDP
jgi:GntR family transcriptional regulator/MocR family aminotransferase